MLFKSKGLKIVCVDDLKLLYQLDIVQVGAEWRSSKTNVSKCHLVLAGWGASNAPRRQLSFCCQSSAEQKVGFEYSGEFVDGK